MTGAIGAKRKGPASSLLRRLYGAFVAVAVVGVCATGALVDQNVQHANLAHFEDRLASEAKMLSQMTAGALFGPLDDDDALSLDESVHALGASVGTRLSLISPSGHVVADSGVGPSERKPGANEALMPEILEAARLGRGSNVRETDAGPRLYVAAPIVRDGATLGYARSSVLMAEVHAAGRDVRLRTTYGAIAATLLALALGFALSRRLVQPLRALTEGARRVGAGDLHTEIPITTHDELGELAMAFNAMTHAVQGMVSELSAQNAATRLVLDNVDQGLVTVDLEGRLGGQRSAALDRWFGVPQADTSLWNYLLPTKATERAYFRLSWQAIGADVLPIELAIEQIPKRFSCGTMCYELSCLPIRDGDRLDKVLVVISDITARVERERVEAEQREMLAAFGALLHDPAGFHDFFEEAAAMAREIREGREPVAMRRSIHTLKGNAAAFGLTRVAMACDAVEDALADRSNPSPTPTERESIWQSWSAIAGQLEVLMAQEQPGYINATEHEFEALLGAVLRGQSGPSVAAMLSAWRLDLASRRLERLATQARALARRLGKGEVDVVVDGASVRVPREPWRPFWAALIHVVRNAVDHGLETPSERVRLGKPPTARIELLARPVGNGVSIEIRDDGRGIDWAAVARAVSARGLPAATRSDLVAALFEEGTTTRREATDISGRGVGLAAARDACARLGGRVEVEDGPTCGAVFRFIVPTGEGGTA